MQRIERDDTSSNTVNPSLGKPDVCNPEQQHPRVRWGHQRTTRSDEGQIKDERPRKDRSTQRVMRVWVSAGASTRSNYVQQVTDKSVDVRLLHVRVAVATCSALGISRGIRHLLLDTASFLYPSLLGQIKE